MEDELKWEWGISKVSVIRSSFETFSLSFHEVSEVMRNSEIEFVQSKSTDLVTLIHLEWPFGRSRAGKWHSGVFHHPPRAPSYWCQARHMALPVHLTQRMERNNILQELTKNKGQASTLTCALLLAQKGPERGGRSRACRGQGSGCLWPWRAGGHMGGSAPPGQGLSSPGSSFPCWCHSLGSFPASGSSWSSWFSSERLSWMLLCALHHWGCSQ